MIFLQCIPEKVAVEMGIDLSGCYAFMSQHFLYGSQISTPFHQVGSKRMSKGMRRDVFVDSGLNSQRFNKVENHYATELPSASIQKKKIFLTRLYSLVLPNMLLVLIDVFHGIATNGYQSFFISFANDADKPFFRIIPGAG